MKIVRGTGWLLTLLLVCATLCVLPVKAEETPKTIRVGYPIQKGLSQMDENGGRYGYNCDYLTEIAKYTGWQYEFVDAEGTLNEQLTTLLEMLKQGQIDLLGGMIYSDGLAGIYDYPGTSYGTSYYALCALDTNTEITGDNYYLKPVLRVAIYSTGKEKNAKLEQFAQMSGINAEQIFCESEEEMLRMLEEDRADVLLAKDVSLPTDNLDIIARFSPQPYYFATTKGNKDIVNGMDKALASISRNNPYFATNLWNEYFPAQSSSFYFSEEEKEFIKNAEPLRVLLLGGRPPIQYTDKETGIYRGVSVDLLSWLEEKTGLAFTMEMTESFDEYERLMKSGETDIAMGVMDDLHQYEWQDVMTTMPYLEAPVSLVLTEKLNPENIAGKHLAMARGAHYDGEYKGKVSYFETGQACLDAVHNGQADYCYANAYSIQYYTGDPRCRNLIVIPQDGEWKLRFCIGILDPENEILAGILNKAIQDFSRQELLQSYLYRNAYQQGEVTLSSYLSANPMEAVMLCILFLMTVILVVLMMIRRKDRKNQLIRRLENQRYEQLSEISNELLFEYDVRSDQMKLSEKCAEYLNMPRVMDRVSYTSPVPGSFVERVLKGKEINGEMQLPVTGGETHWMRITTKGIRGEDGTDIYLVGKLTDIQEEREEKEKLQVKAERDSLTGVYNMATFRERVLQMYERLDAEAYAFYIIDIDYFKRVNDTYGHYIGDLVLEKIGRILMEVFSGENDETGRLGGDEFVAQTVYEGNDEDIREKCGRLNRIISDVVFEGRREPVTVSIGVATVTAGRDFEEAYRQADEALYEVKREGRNSYRIYERREDTD